MDKSKVIYTLDDLYDFCVSNKLFHFNSEETGYKLSVQVPAVFEQEDECEDPSIVFASVILFHTGLNRNNCSVTEEAAKKALKTIPYKPLLGDIQDITDPDTGEVYRDFTSHTFYKDDDGNTKYVERQIGTFTADEPQMIYDEKSGRYYIKCRAAIPTEYTEAVDIIKRKEGTKVSVELIVNQMEFSAKEKLLQFTDVIVQGGTCLGHDKDTGKEIREGMENSRLDLETFSQENNGVVEFNEKVQSQNMKLIESLEKLNETLSNFNVNKITDENFAKGGQNEMNKFEELLEKYNKTSDDITFEWENLSDEELEAKFEEEFGEKEPNKEDDDAPVEDEHKDEPTEDDNPTEPEESEEPDDVKDEEEDTDEPETHVDTSACGGKKKKRWQIEDKVFELSLDEKCWALHELVNDVYADENCYFGCTVYESHVVMHDYCNGRHYRQSYEEVNEVFSLVGDRVEVFATYVTQAEKDALELMKANYSSISEELQGYKDAESFADKMTVFEDEAYAQFLETDEFKALMKKDNVMSCSKEELVNKCDVAFAKLVKANKTFSYVEKEEPNKRNSVQIFSDFNSCTDEEKEMYGDYFKSIQ